TFAARTLAGGAGRDQRDRQGQAGNSLEHRSAQHGRLLPNPSPPLGRVAAGGATLFCTSGIKTAAHRVRWGRHLGEGGPPLRIPPRHIGGRITLSMTWMTPLLAATSAWTTWASLIFTAPPEASMATSEPSTVVAEESFTTSAAITLPETT